MTNGRRKVGIIKRRFSSKWTNKVVWVKRAERVRREGQGRIDDLRWKINEVVIEFKKKDEFSLLAAGGKRRKIEFR